MIGEREVGRCLQDLEVARVILERHREDAGRTACEDATRMIRELFVEVCEWRRPGFEKQCRDAEVKVRESRKFADEGLSMRRAQLLDNLGLKDAAGYARNPNST